MKFDAEAWAKRLTGPGGVTRFNKEWREQQPAWFGSAFSRPEAELLASAERLEEGLESGSIAAGQVDIFNGEHLVRLTDLLHKTGQSAVSMACEQLGRGATLRVRDVQKGDPQLSAFAAAVQRDFAAPAQINLYLTPAGCSGFPPHFDVTDVLVAQIEGAKTWRLHPNYTEQRSLPQVDTAWAPDRFQPIGESVDQLLQAGDVLYLPRGAMHSAECQESHSLHLTISLSPLTVADVVIEAIRRLADKDEALRRRVTLTVEGGLSEDLALAAVTRELIAARLDELEYCAVIAGHRDRIKPGTPFQGPRRIRAHLADSRRAAE